MGASKTEGEAVMASLSLTINNFFDSWKNEAPETEEDIERIRSMSRFIAQQTRATYKECKDKEKRKDEAGALREAEICEAPKSEEELKRNRATPAHQVAGGDPITFKPENSSKLQGNTSAGEQDKVTETEQSDKDRLKDDRNAARARKARNRRCVAQKGRQTSQRDSEPMLASGAGTGPAKAKPSTKINIPQPHQKQVVKYVGPYIMDGEHYEKDGRIIYSEARRSNLAHLFVIISPRTSPVIFDPAPAGRAIDSSVNWAGSELLQTAMEHSGSSDHVPKLQGVQENVVQTPRNSKSEGQKKSLRKREKAEEHITESSDTAQSTGGTKADPSLKRQKTADTNVFQPNRYVDGDQSSASTTTGSPTQLSPEQSRATSQNKEETALIPPSQISNNATAATVATAFPAISSEATATPVEPSKSPLVSFLEGGSASNQHALNFHPFLTIGKPTSTWLGPPSIPRKTYELDELENSGIWYIIHRYISQDLRRQRWKDRPLPAKQDLPSITSIQVAEQPYIYEPEVYIRRNKNSKDYRRLYACDVVERLLKIEALVSAHEAGLCLEETRKCVQGDWTDTATIYFEECLSLCAENGDEMAKLLLQYDKDDVWGVVKGLKDKYWHRHSIRGELLINVRTFREKTIALAVGLFLGATPAFLNRIEYARIPRSADESIYGEMYSMLIDRLPLRCVNNQRVSYFS